MNKNANAAMLTSPQASSPVDQRLSQMSNQLGRLGSSVDSLRSRIVSALSADDVAPPSIGGAGGSGLRTVEKTSTLTERLDALLEQGAAIEAMVNNLIARSTL